MLGRGGLSRTAANGSEPGGDVLAREAEAHGLVERLPDLLIEAQRIASTVSHGIHGRRRAGPGETFWQFRQFETSDPAVQIDWRRSASSDHLYVREREWEAAHTMWLWPDLSPSMAFHSKLSPTPKGERAIVLMLAAAELLVRGGERVAVMGLGRPTSSRNATQKIAQAIIGNRSSPVLSASLPPSLPLSKYSGALLFGDFLDPLETINERIQQIAARGVKGHIVQVLDPAEETLPYNGRAEFIGPESGIRYLADRTESLRDDYQKELQRHRAGLTEIAAHIGWSFMVHHTDRPATEPLLALIMRLQGGAAGYQWSPMHGGSKPATTRANGETGGRR